MEKSQCSITNIVVYFSNLHLTLILLAPKYNLLTFTLPKVIIGVIIEY